MRMMSRPVNLDLAHCFNEGLCVRVSLGVLELGVALTDLVELLDELLKQVRILTFRGFELDGAHHVAQPALRAERGLRP